MADCNRVRYATSNNEGLYVCGWAGGWVRYATRNNEGVCGWVGGWVGQVCNAQQQGCVCMWVWVRYATRNN
jgi:hypothetical protein